MPTKHILLYSCTHCGHMTGLCPPDWENNKCGHTQTAEQARRWEQWVGWIKELTPASGAFDCVIDHGDLIDGSGRRSMGVECITTDLLEQARMAIAARAVINTKAWRFCGGTPYHDGDGTDYADYVASSYGARVEDICWWKCNGRVGKSMHQMSRSGTPVGGDISMRKVFTWNQVNAAKGIEPLAHIQTFGHTHLVRTLTDYDADGREMHAVQVGGNQGSTRYGARRCQGGADIAMMRMDIPEDPSERVSLVIKKEAIKCQTETIREL